MKSKKSSKKTAPSTVIADDNEIHGTITDRHGNVYSEVAIRKLLATIVYGKAVITHYPTKTSYNFFVGRKRGWSNKTSSKIYSETIA